MGRRIEDIETGQADPRRSDRKRREALDGARKEFERFVTENPDDLVLKRQLAALHRYAGNVSRLLGDYAEANAAYKASIALWGELADREPDEPSHRDNLALTLRDAATVQKRSGRLKDAAATLDRAAALAEEVKGRVPAVWYQRTLGGTLLDRADVEYRLGNFAAAEQTAGQAIALFDALKQVPAGQTNATDPIFAGLAALVRGEALREQGKDREAPRGAGRRGRPGGQTRRRERGPQRPTPHQQDATGPGGHACPVRGRDGRGGAGTRSGHRGGGEAGGRLPADPLLPGSAGRRPGPAGTARRPGRRRPRPRPTPTGPWPLPGG